MKATENKNNKHWIDINGNLKNDFYLKQISKSWDQKTWDNFLDQTLKNDNKQNIKVEFLNSTDPKYMRLYNAIKQLTPIFLLEDFIKNGWNTKCFLGTTKGKTLSEIYHILLGHSSGSPPGHPWVTLGSPSMENIYFSSIISPKGFKKLHAFRENG